jgi:hypothetical protein
VPFSGVNHCVRTSGGARCTGADGPWPGVERSTTKDRAKGFLPDGRTVRAYKARRSAHAQGRRRSPAAPGSRSREGPRRVGEILGVV